MGYRVYTPKNSSCLAKLSRNWTEKREREREREERRERDAAPFGGQSEPFFSATSIPSFFLMLLVTSVMATLGQHTPPHSQMRSGARVSCVPGLHCRMDYHTAMAAGEHWRTMRCVDGAWAGGLLSGDAVESFCGGWLRETPLDLRVGATRDYLLIIDR
jgi:hypothetical protein